MARGEIEDNAKLIVPLSDLPRRLWQEGDLELQAGPVVVDGVFEVLCEKDQLAVAERDGYWDHAPVSRETSPSAM